MTITINNKTSTVTIARQGTQGPPGGGGGGADLSDDVPHALGTAAAGTGTKASRDDHVHAMPTASDVGADAAGAATAAVASHVGAADPHPQYTTPSEAAAVAPVQTVAGRTGNVTLAVADVSGAVDTADARLSDARTPTAHTHPLSDLTQSGATTNQVPQWNGSAWVPATVSGGGVPSVRSASADAGGGSTYVYMGVADSGTLTSASAWSITRLTVDGGGGLTATKHATTNPSSVWNDYASLTYT